MKRIIIAFVVLVLTAGLVFALRVEWPDNKRPRLALGDAYHCAVLALGSATNEFYCVGASCLISRSPDGEWMFCFFSTHGLRKTAFVFFDKTTRIEDGRVRF
jgi:hypothetical protein